MSGNSCAGYVQFRAGPAIIDRVAEVNTDLMTEDVSFISEYDGFVLKQDAPSHEDRRKLYLPSEKKMEEFQQTLKRFNDTLARKKVFSRLGIPARNPKDFDIDYILSIAARISDWNQNSEDIHACRRFARKLCQNAVKNKNVLWDLISLAPTDTYGCLISGGFTIVLAAMENHEKLRGDMEQSLARIPKELSKIRRLTNVHIQRDDLHKHADDVLVSIFTVLERIIEKLSRTWKENISSKFKDNGGSVQDALQSLADSIVEFNDEAEVCAHLRIGRMEEIGQALKYTVDTTKDSVIGTHAKITEMGSQLMGISENQTIVRSDQKQLLEVANRLYEFIAGNSALNPIDGTVNRKYLQSTEAKVIGTRNKNLVEEWFKRLGEFESSSKNHIQKFIDHAATLALEEQDKVNYIMDCQPFQDWLGKPQSSVLCVRAETAPNDIINFISVSTAMLAHTLGSATNFILLSCFCSLRKKASVQERDSGALGIMKSLNGQFLRFMLKRQPPIELPFDQDDKIWNGATERLKHSRNLFKKLMTLLPPGSVVFVLMDSVSRTSGDKSQVDEVAEMILQIGRGNPSIVVKFLTTDPIPSSHMYRMADFQLYVPDDVDGGQCGMNAESVKKKNALKLRDLVKPQKELSESDEEE